MNFKNDVCYTRSEIFIIIDIGAAYLVKNKAENKEYIAKKILLGTMIKNEQDSAMMEVNLLRALKHPNIVDYKTSFITQGMLIIVMEYCEGKDTNISTNKNDLSIPFICICFFLNKMFTIYGLLIDYYSW